MGVAVAVPSERRDATSAPRRRRLPRALFAVAAGYVLLAIAYSAATPILETPDENRHIGVVWVLASEHRLPVMNWADNLHFTMPRTEAGQPPLYYALAAAATFWLFPPYHQDLFIVNPFADAGSPNTSDWNKNIVVHTDAEAFPWHGFTLAVHLARLVSVACGLVTILALAATARLLIADRAVASLAVALAAFNPMFLFITSAVDNDALACAVSAVALLLLVRALRAGPTPRLTLLTGVVLGVACLAKLSAAGALVLAVLTYAWLAWRRRDVRQAVRDFLLLLGPAALLSAWWFLRNVQLYGDAIGFNEFVPLAGRRNDPITLLSILHDLASIWLSFWGVFGLSNILLPPYYYVIFDLLAALAGAGLLVALARPLKRRRADPAFLLVAGWLVLLVLLLLRYTFVAGAQTGRLLLPAIGSVALLLAVGLGALAGRWRSLLARALSVALPLGAALAIPLSILPAYAAPPFLALGQQQPAQQLGYRYGPLELVGATLAPGPWKPGSTATVTLFWTMNGAMTRDAAISVQMRGPDGLVEAQTDSLPGGGKVLTTRWAAHTLLVDTVPLRVWDQSPTPSIAHLTVHVYPVGEPGLPYRPTDAAGQPVPVPEVGRVVLEGGRPVQPPPPLALPLHDEFGGQIVLEGAAVPARVAPGADLRVTLRWRALRAPAADFTVFVHAIAPDGKLAFQADARPHGGGLPTTDWVAGQLITDTLTLHVPPATPAGKYQLRVGLYRLQTGVRLALANGTDAVPLASVEVTPPSQR